MPAAWSGAKTNIMSVNTAVRSVSSQSRLLRRIWCSLLMSSTVIAVAPLARRQPIFINGFILPVQRRLQAIHICLSGASPTKIHNENNESAFGLIAIKLECSSTRRLHGLQQEAVHGRSRGGLTSKI